MIVADDPGDKPGVTSFLNRPVIRWLILAATGLVLLAASIFAGFDEGPFPRWIWTVIASSIACGLLTILTAYSWRGRTPGVPWLLLVVIAGLAFRIVMMQADRELSDDAFRYHWDGKVVSHGINPYVHAPDDPGVAHLHTDEIDERINHPWYRTCYPPVAQYLFAASYLLSPGSLTGFQSLCLLAELVTWFLLIGYLRRRSLSTSWIVLAAWSPLVAFQGYLPGHLDLLALPFVTIFVLATADRRPWSAGIALALACLIKPLPLIFVPAALREFGIKGSVRFILVFVAAALVSYLPFLDAGGKLFSSTWLMATKWSFNGSIGAILESILPMSQAHLLSAILLAIAIMIATRLGRDLLSRMLLASVAFIVFTPTLFPWYLIGFIPLLVLRPDAALLSLVILIPLADQVVIDHHVRGVWRLASWVQYAEYITFFALLLLGTWRGFGMFSRSAATGDTRG